jgi:hypothetical protein
MRECESSIAHARLPNIGTADLDVNQGIKEIIELVVVVWSARRT